MRTRMRDMLERRTRRDGRNPYGSRGGYVVSSKSRRDRSMGYDYAYPERNYRYDSRYDAERYYTPYDMGGEYTRQRGRYMDDYATEDLMGEYRKDLRKWADKLKRKDRFNIPKEEIIEQAKKMGVSFNKYDEEEFYTIYLMHISDYPEIANDYYTYVAMAKKWLEDDDIEVSPSEKVCIYMYDIVMGEED